jgi:hypothetical protein
MPKYPAAVQWLLQAFATEEMIAASYQKVFTAKQLSEEKETSSRNRSITPRHCSNLPSPQHLSLSSAFETPILGSLWPKESSTRILAKYSSITEQK